MSSLVAAASLAARGAGGRSSVSGFSAAVFGSTGFLGRYVVNQLGRIGSQVTAAYRGDELNARHLRLMGDLGQVVPVAMEARDEESVRRVIGDSNVVVNLMGKHFETSNYSYQAIHVDVASDVARIAREQGVSHFVHVSALAPLQKCDSKWLHTKIESENAVRQFYPNATIVRPGIMFGDEDRFLVRMAREIVNYPAVPVAALGEARVQPVWVNDVAAVVAAAVRDEEMYGGKILELGGPDVYSVEQCYKYVMENTRRETSLVFLPRKVAQFLQMALNFRVPILNPSPMHSEDVMRFELSEPVLDAEKTGVMRFEDLDAHALSMKSDSAREILRRFRKGGDRSSLFYVD